MTHRYLLPLAALLLAGTAQAQQLGPLTVEKIMRDPAQWLGTSPSSISWAEDGKAIYFNWNPEKARRDSLYRIAPTGGAIDMSLSFRMTNSRSFRCPAWFIAS